MVAGLALAAPPRSGLTSARPGGSGRTKTPQTGAGRYPPPRTPCATAALHRKAAAVADTYVITVEASGEVTPAPDDIVEPETDEVEQ